jgi:hypothetical protein
MRRIGAMFFLLALLSWSCEKAAVLPIVTTADVTNVTQMTAKGGGEVTSDGNADITARGLVWSNSPTPEIGTANSSADGTGTGAFTSNITGLGPNTTYYVRAYATNEAGTGYGAEKTFTTPL